MLQSEWSMLTSFCWEKLLYVHVNYCIVESPNSVQVLGHLLCLRDKLALAATCRLTRIAARDGLSWQSVDVSNFDFMQGQHPPTPARGVCVCVCVCGGGGGGGGGGGCRLSRGVRISVLRLTDAIV